MVAGICAGDCRRGPANQDILGQKSICWHYYNTAIVDYFRLFLFNQRHPVDAAQCELVIHCASYDSYPCLYNRITQSDLERRPNSYSWHIFGARSNPRFLVLDLLDVLQYSPPTRDNIYSSVIQSNEGCVSQAEHYFADCCSNAMVWKCDLRIRLITYPQSGYNTICFYD